MSPVASSYQDAPRMPFEAGYSPVTIAVVAAGVIEGKMVVQASVYAPASTSRWRTGRRPVWIAGPTTCGAAPSMTTSSTFTAAASSGRSLV
jgi:hypothetical protein